MEGLLPLASALGLGMLAGARLYATTFALGLLIRFGWISLPAGWDQASVLADTRVLAVAGIACAIEFVADKIPWVDSAWDSLHTFIRPIGAVLLTSSLFSHLDPAYQMLLLLVAGGAAFTGHATKAATRLAVNHSPEPFSNVAVSLAEEAALIGGLYLLVKHPWVLAALALVLLALFLWLAPKTYRAVRAGWKAFGARVRSWLGSPTPAVLGQAEEAWLAEHWKDCSPCRSLAVIASADLKGLRNRAGVLCLAGREAVFFARKWGRLVARPLGPLTSLEVKRGILVDHLALVSEGGSRTRFDLLAGQLGAAQQEMKRLSVATRLT